MGNQVSWLVELAVKPGQLDNFQALTGEMVESSSGESGVLSYQRFVSETAKSFTPTSGMTLSRRWRNWSAKETVIKSSPRPA